MALTAMFRRFVAALLLVQIPALGAAASPWQAGSLPAGAESRYGQHYLVALPDGYEAEPQRAWPLIVFLHGAGEWGTDLAKVKSQGLPAYIEGGAKLPAIVLAPQTPQGQMWHPLFIDAVLREVCGRLRVDADRIYLTGLSLGGMGTWSTALAYPDRFAALAPVAGAFPNDMMAYNRGWPEPSAGDWLPAISHLTHLPVWIAHGEVDPVVPFAMDQRVAAVLKQLGVTPRLDWMANVGHDAWTRTYSETPGFYDWLLAQRRGTQATQRPPQPSVRLAGEYRSADGRVAKVEVRGDRLEVALDEAYRSEFLPIDGQRFIGAHLIRFELDANGQPRRLVAPGIGRFEHQSGATQP